MSHEHDKDGAEFNDQTTSEILNWAESNTRLLIVGLQNIGPGPLDYDEEAVDAVQQRCINKLGEDFGTRYFQTLLVTLPDRRPDRI